jgi:hypothetical protein
MFTGPLVGGAVTFGEVEGQLVVTGWAGLRELF